MQVANMQTAPTFTPEIRIVGIVGAGIMGRGIAQIAVLSGAIVYLADSRAGAAAQGQAEILATLNKLVERGKISAAAAQSAGERLHACAVLEDLAGCDLVIEAIIEDLAAKQALFRALEGIVATTSILATNTSSLSVTAIGAGLQHPQRVAGFHFFNPVPQMKIVEVIAGLLTAHTVCDALLTLGSQWGHAAVRASDTPGFIVNHAGRGYGTEGLRVLAECVTDAATLDAILCDCAGFRLGPCELLDLIGLDVSHPVMESLYAQYYGEPRFRPQGLTRQMLSAGLLGKKSGRGFYSYDAAGKREREPNTEAAAQDLPLPSSVWLSQARPELAQRVADLLQDCDVLLETGARPSATALCIVTPLGDDTTACCVREQLDARHTIAIETLFNLSLRRVIMRNPATETAYVDMARSLFRLHGAAVSVIRDSSGLVAQRVVAHIINIACDMAQQGIAQPADIDRAVVLGLAYPHGPFAWGDLIGPDTVLAILQALLAQSGDPRYRPSPWLTRRAALGLSLLHTED